ncbi:MAG: peptidylprolyl isomerase, partial [Bacteroidaceae bacterium]|nr:peptidylprolyl isomerase [Bacteroidaceae bacterium]
AQVSQEIAVAVEGLNIGEISKPIVMLNKRGKEVCAIVKLKSRIEGHKANLRDDYETLKEVYLSKASEEKVQEWIKQKQKTTFVKINTDSHNCEFKYPGWVFYDDNK